MVGSASTTGRVAGALGGARDEPAAVVASLGAVLLTAFPSALLAGFLTAAATVGFRGGVVALSLVFDAEA